MSDMGAAPIGFDNLTNGDLYDLLLGNKIGVLLVISIIVTL